MTVVAPHAIGFYNTCYEMLASRNDRRERRCSDARIVTYSPSQHDPIIARYFMMELIIFGLVRTKETAMNKRPDLPEPIASYFAADKQDCDAVAQCFTKEAVVKDEGRTHTGLNAIKQWRAEVSTKYIYTSEPFASEQKDGVTIVTSRLTGNFPGSPVNLQFFFRLDRGKIAALEIIP